MAATGIRPEAGGIADRARIRSWDWNNDEAEMASAAVTGLQVSNHSYGTFAGWVFDLQGTGRWAWMGNPALADPATGVQR